MSEHPHLIVNAPVFTILAWGSVLLLLVSLIVIVTIWVHELRSKKVW